MAEPSLTPSEPPEFWVSSHVLKTFRPLVVPRVSVFREDVDPVAERAAQTVMVLRYAATLGAHDLDTPIASRSSMTGGRRRATRPTSTPAQSA